MKAKRRRRFYDVRRDGVTTSLLTSWMRCREYARLWCLGLSTERPSGAIEWGNMAHWVLQRAYAELRERGTVWTPDPTWVRGVLNEYTPEVPVAGALYGEGFDAEVEREAEIRFGQVMAVLTEYMGHYPDDWNGQTTWVGVEREFSVPAPGRPDIRLRGMMDGVFTRGKTGRAIYLLETKTKGQIESGILDAIALDTQVQVYLYALSQMTGRKPMGVYYNVIRRPQLVIRQGTPGETEEAFEKRVASFKKEETRERKRAEGPRQGKPPEGLDEFIQRCADDVRERPEHYFHRFRVAITPQEMRDAEANLGAIIDEFVRWHDGELANYRNGAACRFPYPCRYLDHCSSGDRDGLVTRAQVFPEFSGAGVETMEV